MCRSTEESWHLSFGDCFCPCPTLPLFSRATYPSIARLKVDLLVEVRSRSRDVRYLRAELKVMFADMYPRGCFGLLAWGRSVLFHLSVCLFIQKGEECFAVRTFVELPPSRRKGENAPKIAQGGLFTSSFVTTNCSKHRRCYGFGGTE